MASVGGDKGWSPVGWELRVDAWAPLGAEGGAERWVSKWRRGGGRPGNFAGGRGRAGSYPNSAGDGAGM